MATRYDLREKFTGTRAGRENGDFLGVSPLYFPCKWKIPKWAHNGFWEGVRSVDPQFGVWIPPLIAEPRKLPSSLQIRPGPGAIGRVVTCLHVHTGPGRQPLDGEKLEGPDGQKSCFFWAPKGGVPFSQLPRCGASQF